MTRFIFFSLILAVRAAAQNTPVEISGRVSAETPRVAAAPMAAVQAGGLLATSLSLASPNAPVLSAPAAMALSAAPVPAQAQLAAFAARAAELTVAAPAPAAAAPADAGPAAAPAPAVSAPVASAPQGTDARARGEGARSTLLAASEVLKDFTVEQIQGMSVEDLNATGRKIMERVLGAASSESGAAAVLASPSGARAALAPAGTRAAALTASVPAPKAFDKRTLVWPSAVLFVWSSWATLMTLGHHWALFAHDWFMTATMAVGSFVAGASSEGSGAISFPVMTLLFHIKPAVARDFSLMIQAVGMTTAALTILAMGVKVEKRAIVVGALAGFAGMALGLTYVAPLFAPPFAKMFFTSLWAAFALALWRLNRDKARVVVDAMTSFHWKDVALLAAFGVLGGMVSSIVGTGLCMVMFMLLVLGYKMSEKVATPTSIILMASNALFGFLFKTVAQGGMSPEAWNYWWVCVPIVVVGAPLGARFMRSKSRHFVAGFLYSAIALQLLAALLVIHQTVPLLLTAGATFAAGSLAFRLMARRGLKNG